MTAKKTDDTSKAAKAEELKDTDLDKAAGGFSWGCSNAGSHLVEKPADKPLSGTDLGSGRVK